MDEKLLLSALLDNMPDHIYFKDRASRFLLVNKAQARTLGVANPEDAVGKSDSDYFSREHAQQAFIDEQEIIKTGKPLIAMEEKETWPDGSITWVSTTKSPFRNEHGEVIGTFGISKDITELKKARAVMEEVERDRVMLESISAVCHHMSQPLTVILTIARMLGGDTKMSDVDLQDMLKDIATAAETLSDKMHKLNEVNKYKTEKYIDDVKMLEV